MPDINPCPECETELVTVRCGHCDTLLDLADLLAPARNAIREGERRGIERTLLALGHEESEVPALVRSLLGEKSGDR